MEDTENKPAGEASTRAEAGIASQPARRNTRRSFSLLKVSKFPVRGQVRDVNGALFDVRDARVTKHGFDLPLGTPDNRHGLYSSNRPELILTTALRDFWRENRTKYRGFLFDLPACQKTLSRARKRLGFNRGKDVRKFWTERIDDLKSLGVREFGAKHGVERTHIRLWRYVLGVTRRHRAEGWWRRPEVLGVLLSGRTSKEAARALDIPITRTRNLRVQAQKDYPKIAARSTKPVSLLKGHKYPVCGQVRDVDGALWDVRDVRSTKHGFDLYLGSLDGARGRGAVGGLPHLIVTKELRDYWRDNREKSHGVLYDLPAGRSTLRRARTRLRFNQREARREFWMDRVEDLATMPIREFAAKHDVSPDVAFDWRFRLVGYRARPLGWWRTPETIKILLSDMTLSQVGRELGIGTSHAMRLRRRAKQESS
jgi:hypothetical protein